MSQRVPACSHYSDRLGDGSGVSSKPSFKSRVKAAIANDGESSRLFRAARRAYRALHASTVFHDRYYSNNNLGIFVTAACNLSCHNCQTSAKQAVSSDMLSVEQLRSIVDEAIRLEYFWDRIVITGGEASLHPQFFDLLAELDRYRSFHPECQFVLETNGVGPKVNAVLDRLAEWVLVNNSSKAAGTQSYAFATYNVAPIDVPAYRFSDFSKGCSRISVTYGLCATMYGYYPCSPCMNVARVFGFDVGIPRLDQVDESALREQMKVLCRYCGWFKAQPNDVVWTEKMSRSWEDAFERYKTRKPELSRYQP